MRKIPGLLAIVFYLSHMAYFIYHGEIYHILWTCHTGCLLVGLGHLIKSGRLNAIGFIWLSIGIPLWVVNLVTGGEFLITSMFTHLGGFFIGLYGFKDLKFPELSWLYGIIYMALFAVVSMIITPPALNINLIHSVWKGWEDVFHHYYIYLLFILVYVGLAHYVIESLIRKIMRLFITE